MGRPANAAKDSIIDRQATSVNFFKDNRELLVGWALSEVAKARIIKGQIEIATDKTLSPRAQTAPLAAWFQWNNRTSPSPTTTSEADKLVVRQT